LAQGGVLRDAQLAYERFGPDDAEHIVLICHALTGDAHVTRHDQDDPSERKGWWEVLVGPGCAIDTDTTAVLCANVLGGCAGSTGPASINPDTGQHYGPAFPAVTVADVVASQERMLDALGITQPVYVIGGSIGGFQALEWIRTRPERLAGAAIIASGVNLGSYGLAHNEIARGAIRADVNFKSGWYDADCPPTGGLAAARQLAHLTYRTPQAFDRRFGRERDDGQFNLASYLAYKGSSFVQRFDTNTYLAMLDLMDEFDAARDNALEEGFKSLRGPLLIAGISSDLLFPPAQSCELASIASAVHADCGLEVIATEEGHDAFLMPSDELENAVASLLPTSPT
jgi:homoserine O-acetyltransferase